MARDPHAARRSFASVLFLSTIGLASAACGAKSDLGGTQAPVCQGKPCTLASGQKGSNSLTIDSTSVYWGDFSVGVFRVGLDGKGTAQIAPASQMLDLAVDDANVYWTSKDGLGSPAILKVPKVGGTVAALVANLGAPQRLTLDATNVYWSEGAVSGGAPGRVMSIPKAGGAPTQIAGALADVVADGDFIYATSNDTNAGIVRVPKVGGAVQQLAAVPAASGGMGGVAVDDQFAYAAVIGTSAQSYKDAEIIRVPKGGGDVAVIASAQFRAVRLAVDADHVYWGNLGSGTSADGAIMRVAKAGGTAETIASSQAAPSAISVDSGFVYWVNAGTSAGDDGAVLRIAKP